MKTLKPVNISEYYINRVASGMSRYFWDKIFKNIFDILKNDNTVINSKDDVIAAIKSGKIWYENGAFRTKDRFTNGVAKTLEELGATFKYNAYYISKSAIPVEYLNLLALTSTKALQKADTIIAFLNGLQFSLSETELEKYIQGSVELMYRKLELDILQSMQNKEIPLIELGIVQPKVNIPKTKTKPIEDYWDKAEKKAQELHNKWEKAKSKYDEARLNQKGLSAKEYEGIVSDYEKASSELAKHQANKYQNAPQLDIKIDDVQLDDKSKKIAEDYTYNMKYWVKNWEAKNIIEMRQDVLKMVQQGARVPRLEEYFMKRWGIAKNKAHFLAVNESRLAGTAIKAEQYQSVGCPGYIWGRSRSKEKRELHKHYYGKFFTWDDKPIIDEKLGIKGYPQQIWNCDCQMLIVPPTLEQAYNKVQEIRNAKRNIFTKIKYHIQNSTQRNNNAWRYRRFGEGQTL